MFPVLRETEADGPCRLFEFTRGMDKICAPFFLTSSFTRCASEVLALNGGGSIPLPANLAEWPAQPTHVIMAGSGIAIVPSNAVCRTPSDFVLR